MYILGLSKTLIDHFHYNYLKKKYSHKLLSKWLFAGTDSQINDIKYKIWWYRRQKYKRNW